MNLTLFSSKNQELKRGFLEMGDIEGGWSWEENKLFEVALAVVDEEEPDRWEVVAAMVGGQRSAEDVYSHYVILLQDLEFIESGNLDHKFIDDFLADQFLDLTVESLCCNDEEDHSLLVYLEIH